jgi:NADPH:quinone reductase-like Zn-dependent oxidoreductase
MKAMRLNEWGKVLQMEEIPQPIPASDEVLVQVRAASINPFDDFVRAGYLQGMITTPLTLGTDFAGEVVAAGSEITHVKPGDAVYGLVPLHSGSFAEYLVAKANEVALKPKSLSFVEAAGVPLASLAACQSLFTLGQAQSGEQILVIGAAGAVGGCAVQLIHEVGAYIFAVDLPEKADFVRALGVDCFINSKEERYEDIVGKVDLVLDFVGGENVQRAYSVLKDGGRYVTSLVLPASQPEAEQRGIRSMGLATQANVQHLNDMAQRIDSGQLKIFINRSFPLQDAQTALEYRLTTTDSGKIVLTIP